MYRFAATIIHFFLSTVYRFQVSGKENLPSNTGFVIACTHQGWLDVVALGVSIYPLRIHFMAKKELFRYRLSRWVLTQLQSFPVNRENPGPSSLKIPIRLLKKGEVVGIFPSGTRTSDAGMPLKRGAVYLAEKAHVPLVPAIFEGPSEVRWADIWKKRTMSIKIGQPINPGEESDLLEILDQRMKELRES